MAALGNLAGLLICGIGPVRQAVAERLWHEPESSLDWVFNILGNKGIVPAGVLADEGAQAAVMLRGACPQDRIAYFREKALQLFGPSVAGVKVDASRSTVTFKTKYTKPIGPADRGTYTVYSAPSKEAALAFLESQKVNKEYFYIEVETPEGPVGKDKMGIY